MTRAMSDVSKILKAVDDGDRHAAEQLLPLVYDELRSLAKSRLAAERTGQTLQATDLVHEAYERLVQGSDVWKGRGHFFGAAAEAMRRILIDRAREKAAIKRGGKRKRVALDGLDHPAAQRPEELLELDAALSKLEEVDPQKAELVKLRFFAGLTTAQAARVVGISSSTADRYWSYVRAWLRVEINKDREA